jgi:carbon catabolite-derepressing protein kinase
MLPELTQKKEYDGKDADIWATGILMYVILTDKLPFSGKDEKTLFRKIVNGVY